MPQGGWAVGARPWLDGQTGLARPATCSQLSGARHHSPVEYRTCSVTEPRNSIDAIRPGGSMLAKDQIKLIAQEIHRTADVRMHQCNDEYDRQRLWEVVRHASHAIESVAEMERDGMTAADRQRRARALLLELESALEAARQAKVVMDWSVRGDDRGGEPRDARL
jgi:hypothetical protein